MSRMRFPRPCAASKLTLNGVTLRRGLADMADRASTSHIYVSANTDNVIEGDIDFPDAPTVNWSFGANSSLRVKGSIKRYTTNWCYFGNNGTLYLDGPLKMDGVYGAANNTAVPAANRLPCFTGRGRIVFLGINRGTLMFFR